MPATMKALSALALLVALVPATVVAFHASAPLQPQQHTARLATRAMAAGGGGYQEQLARARAEKAARQAAAASGQPYQPPPPPPPPMARPPPPPPPPMQQQQQQQEAPPSYQQQPAPPAAPQAGLSGGTQDAVATLLAILGERLGSGRPLSPQRVQAFSQAAEALVAEARTAAAAPAAQYTPPPLQQQYAPPPPQPPQQQYYSQPRPQAPAPAGDFAKPGGFEQDEDIPWELGSRTLTGPQPGYRSASAFVPSSGFDEEADDFSQGLPQPVTRGQTTGTKSPFMQTLKGTPFYVDVDQQQVTPDEYRQIIGKRVAESQMARRQNNKYFGNEAANAYMDELNKAKQARLREQAQQQSQQWQQQMDGQQQQQGGGYYQQ